MKTIKTLALIAVFLVAGKINAQSVTEKWPAIKAFHEVMSRTFHPSENGDLKPLRAESQLLFDRAMDLTKSEVPKEFQTKAIMESVQRLQEKTREVNKLVVGKGPDDSLTRAIGEAHDIFHEIVGMCSKTEKH